MFLLITPVCFSDKYKMFPARRGLFRYAGCELKLAEEGHTLLCSDVNVINSCPSKMHTSYLALMEVYIKVPFCLFAVISIEVTIKNDDVGFNQQFHMNMVFNSFY